MLDSICKTKNDTVWFYNAVLSKRDTDGMSTSLGSDQTAPLAAV